MQNIKNHCQLINLEELDGNRTIAKKIFNSYIKIIWGAKKYLKFFITKLFRIIKNEKWKGMIIDDGLKFFPGELVKVRSKDEIKFTLDEWGETKRCTYLRIMYEYCDKTFRVHKNINYFYDETKIKLVKSKNIVILEDVYCNGKRRVFKKPCDRNCFLFWHTSWIKKVREK